MISARLKKVILEELELDDFDITDKTQANQIPGWDSLNHVRIIVAIEKEYNIRLRSLEVIRLKNLGELQALIDKNAKP